MKEAAQRRSRPVADREDPKVAFLHYEASDCTCSRRSVSPRADYLKLNHARTKVKRLRNMQDPENKSGSASAPVRDEQQLTTLQE